MYLKGVAMRTFKFFVVAMCGFIVLLACACARELSPEQLNKVYDRLELVDEFYEQNVPKLSDNPIAAQETGTFRNVPFGSLRSVVEESETLELFQQYENAIDFIETPVFDCSMVPTYWFNSSDQLFRGTYSYSSSLSIDKIISSISLRLNDLYGQPSDSNFYTYDNEIAAWNSNDELLDLISSNQVYYYVDYIYSGIDIEFIIEAGESSSDSISYDVYIMFTDYTYKD